MGKYDKMLTFGLLVLDAIYFALIKQLPVKAARYPMFICILLAVLTLVLGVQTFMNKDKTEVKLFEGFIVKQFFFVIVISAIYIGFIDFIGFFVTTFVYLLLTMLGLKAKPMLSAITSAGFCVVIYLVFVTFLKVPVPTGILI